MLRVMITRLISLGSYVRLGWTCICLSPSVKYIYICIKMKYIVMIYMCVKYIQIISIICIYDIYIYIYIYIMYIISCADSMDFPDSLCLFVPIIYHTQQVLQTTSNVCTKLMWVFVSWPILVHPCFGFHRTSLMTSFLLFQQYPTCLVCLNWVVFEIGGKWLYSCCFVGCYFQDLFKTACSILV